MIITNYKLFKEQKTELVLHYYAFDWDDNLLFMPSKLYVINDKGEEVEVETHEFAKYRSVIGKEDFKFKGHTIIGYIQKEDGSGIDYDSSLRNFRDHRDPYIFKKDTKLAIDSGDFGPSWPDFIECLISGSLFAIITARGHESPSIRKSVEYIIDDYLTQEQKDEMYNNILKYSYLFNRNIDYNRFYKGKLSSNPLIKDYLDMCEFIGVSAPSRIDHTNAMNPEKAKLKALLDFASKINKNAGNIGMKARIGFSDDDNQTVKIIEDLFDEIDNEEFPHIIQWIVKNTNDPNKVTKKVNNINR